MRIARDGTWYHEGAPIGRPAMVRLFSTILRREPDGRYVLVTPVEKLDIEVEAPPFLAVEMKSEGEGRDRRIAFRLDTGDAVIPGPEHPLRFVDTEPGPRPDPRPPRARGRARPRRLLRARRARACRGRRPAGVWSDGAFFALERSR